MTIEFEDSGVVLLEIDAGQDGGVQIDDIDIGETIGKISPEEISDATRSVAAVGAALFETSEAPGWKKPESVEVEFGIAVGVGGRLIVAKGDVKAHLKIKIKW